MSEIVLSLRNICKTYIQGDVMIKVLDNVNLEVGRGELIGIIGNSGSGKSTLLHIAGLLDMPDTGFVTVAGALNHKASNANLVRLRNIGFIYQQHHLLKDFSAIENVAMPLLIMGQGSERSFKDAEKILNKLGLSQKINHLPGELSGGEQQRVAIARSLINKPKIILADEPTGNLDAYNSQEVFDIFYHLAKEQNTAMIIVTHNHEMASKLDRLYELDKAILLPR